MLWGLDSLLRFLLKRMNNPNRRSKLNRIHNPKRIPVPWQRNFKYARS
jgi:hypothetical protein